MLYIRLFHGRTDPAQQMDDWGTDGPILGPYIFCHTTYGCHLKMGRANGDCDELFIVGTDLLYYDGVYYGDWSVFGKEELVSDGFETSVYDASKAEPPKVSKRQAKIIVYIKGGICQDVKSNIPDGCWEYALVDFDNEPDLPDDYVPFSEDEMKPFL